MRRSIDLSRVTPTRAFVARMFTYSIDCGWSMTALIVAGADQGFERYEVVETVEKLCGQGYLEMGFGDLYYCQNGWPACEERLLGLNKSEGTGTPGQPGSPAGGTVNAPVNTEEGSMGYCPFCTAPTKFREKRLDGYDTCRDGHTYPSVSSLSSARGGTTDFGRLKAKYAVLRNEVQSLIEDPVGRWDRFYKSAPGLVNRFGSSLPETRVYRRSAVDELERQFQATSQDANAWRRRAEAAENDLRGIWAAITASQVAFKDLVDRVEAAANPKKD